MTRHSVLIVLVLALAFVFPAVAQTQASPQLPVVLSCQAQESEALAEETALPDTEEQRDTSGQGDVPIALQAEGALELGSAADQSLVLTGSQPCSGPGLTCSSHLNCAKQCQFSGCDATYSWCSSVTNICICDAT